MRIFFFYVPCLYTYFSGKLIPAHTWHSFLGRMTENLILRSYIREIIDSGLGLLASSNSFLGRIKRLSWTLLYFHAIGHWDVYISLICWSNLLLWCIIYENCWTFKSSLKYICSLICSHSQMIFPLYLPGFIAREHRTSRWLFNSLRWLV